MLKAYLQAPKRIIDLQFSAIREMGAIAAELEKKGEEVIHLEIGRPDFDTPRHIKQAAKDALDRGCVHYTSNFGILPLREAISIKLEQEQSLKYDPENEIIATVGAAEGISASLQTFFDPGDGLLLPQPAFINYLNLPRILNLEIQNIPLFEKNGFELDPEDLEKNIRPNSKGLILVSPHNPTGSVISDDKLKAIAELCVKYNLIVLADEVYEKIIYQPKTFKSIATFPGMRERTLLINGFSKTYSMTGWRLGYLVGPKEMVAQVIKIHQNMVTSTCSFAQYGGLAALEGPQSCVREMVEDFEKRRNFLINALSAIGLPSDTPAGAFYVFTKVNQFGMNSRDLAIFLIQKAKVVTVPGVAFGSNGEGYIRISYANSRENLEKAVGAIGEVLERML